MFDSDYMFDDLAASGLSWVLKKMEAEVSIFLLLMTEFDTFKVDMLHGHFLTRICPEKYKQFGLI